MGKFKETLADGALGPERDRVIKDLTPMKKRIISYFKVYPTNSSIIQVNLEGSELTRDERESQLYDALNTSVRTKEKPFTNTMS
nr:hypothetical protein [Tanacetum cinerariifolium]GFB14058.1 hypothetical protein [Tanacetum cinerariifolium]GFB14089.1 hypothetical protein [Tanacetum cinerariifolium]